MSLWLVFPLLVFAFGFGYSVGLDVRRIRRDDALIEGQHLGYLAALEKYGPISAFSMSANPPRGDDD